MPRAKTDNRYPVAKTNGLRPKASDNIDTQVAPTIQPRNVADSTIASEEADGLSRNVSSPLRDGFPGSNENTGRKVTQPIVSQENATTNNGTFWRIGLGSDASRGCFRGWAPSAVRLGDAFPTAGDARLGLGVIA